MNLQLTSLGLILTTMRFIDGLKQEIKSVIMVQRHPNLDTSCAFTLVQEEAKESTRRRRAVPFSNRTAWLNASSLSDCARLDRSIERLTASEKPPTDSTRATSVADQVASLKSYCRALGLCDRCAEMWFQGHKCANTVQLHAIEEV